MLLINRKKEISKILPAVCFSLLFHIVVFGLIFLGLSQNTITPPGLRGLNLVWVSFASNDTGKENGNTASHQSLPDASRPTNIAENKISHSVIPATYTKAVTPFKSFDYNPQKTVTANTYWTTGQTGDSTSPNNAFTAYPLYRENMPPLYPEIARLRGYEGISLIVAEILPTGRVGSVKIKKSSGYSILDKSALEAVKQWQFEPARNSGKPFTMWVEVPIKFVLRKEKSSS